MGQEIESTRFSESDFLEFRQRLESETALLRQWFDDDVFDDKADTFGIELECCLVDDNFIPTPRNDQFLDAINDAAFVPELSKFNFEINSAPHKLDANLLQNMQRELDEFWKKALNTAQAVGVKPIMAGILPTLRDNMLTMEHMSPLNRYYALTEQVLKLRQGNPIEIDIEGKDPLKVKHFDLMLEAAATSLQIHIQVDSKQAARYYNASHVASAPMVAIGANSPYLYGHELWEETRIPLFEQAVSVKGFQGPSGVFGKSVTFGQSYINDSLYEPFAENLTEYPVLLPILFESPPEELRHLKLLNGTVWRWNRPIVGVNTNGRPHLRVEHRSLAAGPSGVDVIANTAFFIGLVRHLAEAGLANEKCLSFERAQNNFYRAAQQGLRADIDWVDGQSYNIQELLFSHLLPQAKASLLSMGLDKDQVEYYMDGVIKARALSGRTGSEWQRNFVDTHGPDFQNLVEASIDWQSQACPVHEWTV